MATTDPRIDAYIAKSQPFAQPILRHIRAVVHEACPAVEETIKWGMPHFDYRGGMMCSMAAFKAHCALGFWRANDLLASGQRRGEAMGNFGRVTSVKDLPGRAALKALVRRAMRLADTRTPRTPRPGSAQAGAGRATPRPVSVPADLARAIARNAAAKRHFAAFPPSHRREYVEWITEAKREETRARRLAQAIEWIAEGKHRNWKYMAKGGR